MSRHYFIAQYPYSELIETMRLNRAGQILLLPLHLQRLQRSAQQLGFKYNTNHILEALQPYLHRWHDQPQRLRLSLSPAGQLTILCTPLPTTPQPVQIRLNLTPISLKASSALLNYKTSQRQHWLAGEQWLQQHPEFFDVIYTNASGFITEGGRTNIYIWHQNHWITPPQELGLLRGVMREWLLMKGWVTESSFTAEQLLTAPAVRISNALRGWVDAKIYANT